MYICTVLIVIHPELMSGSGEGLVTLQQHCKHKHLMKTDVYIWCRVKLTSSMPISIKVRANAMLSLTETHNTSPVIYISLQS